MSLPINQHPASFRDPSGFVYEKSGMFFRFVSVKYKKDYELLRSSGLAAELVKKKLLLPFDELKENHTQHAAWLTTLQPAKIPFLSYPWEWSFDELKDAALATLKIAQLALAKGMLLKDATPLNIQFTNGRPALIDTLSFETYSAGKPWVAYRQFCECFLNPLLLAAYCNMEVHKLFLSYPEGVPVKVTASLLPFSAKLNAAIYLHVFLHARAYEKPASKAAKKEAVLTQKKLEQILASLESCISNLQLKQRKTTWNNYYDETILSNQYLRSKKELVASWISNLSYSTLVDLGANEGEFSLLAKKDAVVISTDFDSSCMNTLYLKTRKEKSGNILPLVIDLTYPSPSVGWANAERKAFLQRSTFDLCFALALVHHLAIGKNIPLLNIAEMLAGITEKYLVVEFVPKTDPKVKEMLQWREDIFSNYSEIQFEADFETHFTLIKKEIITASDRTLYLYQKKS